MALEALSPVDGKEGKHMREGGVSGAVGYPDKLNFLTKFYWFYILSIPQPLLSRIILLSNFWGNSSECLFFLPVDRKVEKSFSSF